MGLPRGAEALPFFLAGQCPPVGVHSPSQQAPHSCFQVVFGKKLPAFATIPLHQLQHEKKYDIYFADGKVFALYR